MTHGYMASEDSVEQFNPIQSGEDSDGDNGDNLVGSGVDDAERRSQDARLPAARFPDVSAIDWMESSEDPPV